MPNWTTNHLVITGATETLDALIAQVSKPYKILADDYCNNPISKKEIEVNELFQLWNIISPTDLKAYHHREEWKPRNESEPLDSTDVVKQFYEDVAVKNDWYNWNLRNWGTKWDVSDVFLERSKNRLMYAFYTAWSPPAEAIDTLAKKYPSLTFTMKCIDEGDLYACELGWNDGKRVVELDLPITHDFNMELRGSCWACDEDNASEEDIDTHKERLGCNVADKYAEELKKGN